MARPDTVMACPSSFAETGYAAGGRDYEFVDVSPLTFHETILPPFVAAIRAGAGSLMAAFNDVGRFPPRQRRPADHLVAPRAVIDGLVAADYNGVPELERHGLGDGEAVSAARCRPALTWTWPVRAHSAHLRACFAAGEVSMNDIDQACRRGLGAKRKLGSADHPLRRMDESRHAAVAASAAEFRQKAREAAARSCVLLKNAGGILPLASSARTIAVIGPLADSADQMSGNWAPTLQDVPASRSLTASGTPLARTPRSCTLEARTYNSSDVSRRAGCHEHFDHRAPEAMRRKPWPWYSGPI